LKRTIEEDKKMEGYLVVFRKKIMENFELFQAYLLGFDDSYDLIFDTIMGKHHEEFMKLLADAKTRFKGT
jgi:hypothetical protein